MGNIKIIKGVFDTGSRWDRYLGMTAAMTQVPVPVTKHGLPPNSCPGREGRFANKVLTNVIKKKYEKNHEMDARRHPHQRRKCIHIVC